MKTVVGAEKYFLWHTHAPPAPPHHHTLYSSPNDDTPPVSKLPVIKLKALKLKCQILSIHPDYSLVKTPCQRSMSTDWRLSFENLRLTRRFLTMSQACSSNIPTQTDYSTIGSDQGWKQFVMSCDRFTRHHQEN